MGKVVDSTHASIPGGHSDYSQSISNRRVSNHEVNDHRVRGEPQHRARVHLWGASVDEGNQPPGGRKVLLAFLPETFQQDLLLIGDPNPCTWEHVVGPCL
jgi:hypothetical protein